MARSIVAGLVLAASPALAVTPEPPGPPMPLTEERVARFAACLPAVLAAEETVERRLRGDRATGTPPDPMAFHRARAELLDAHVGPVAVACGFAEVRDWQRTRASISAALSRGDPLVMRRAEALARLEH